MKIILLSLLFCAIINTANGQSGLLTNKISKEIASDVMDREKDIVYNIYNSKLANTFYKALEACGLIETFNNPGPITVLLPTDSAFNKLSAGVLDTLLMPKNRYNLISVLTYHALPGNLRVKDIAKHIKRGKGKTSLHTVAGAWLTAEFDNNGNIILIDERGGRSTLLLSNLKQENGMVHLVSAVLMPKFRSI